MRPSTWLNKGKTVCHECNNWKPHRSRTQSTKSILYTCRPYYCKMCLCCPHGSQAQAKWKAGDSKMKWPGSFWVPQVDKGHQPPHWGKPPAPGNPMRQKVFRQLQQDYNLFVDNSKLSHITRLLIQYQVKGQLPVKGMDSPYILPIFKPL